MSNKYLGKFAGILNSSVVKGIEKVLDIASNFVPFLGIVADILKVAPGLGDSLKQNQIARDKAEAVNGIIESYRKKLSENKFELLLSAAYEITENEKNHAKKINSGIAIDKKTCDEIMSLYTSYGEFQKKFNEKFEKINSNRSLSPVKDELFAFLTDIGSLIMEMETEILGNDFKILLKNIEKIGEEQHRVTREIVVDETEKIQEEVRGLKRTVTTLAGALCSKNSDEDEPLRRFSITKNRKFVCREKYINDIASEFEKKRIVILFGMGGIGKSEIAKAYASVSSYDCPQMIVISDSFSLKCGLKDVVSAASFTDTTNSNCIALDSEEKQYRYKLEKLRSYGENTLLIVDNYNGISEDNIEDILFNLNCRVLITTRSQNLRINKDISDKVCAIEVNALSDEDLNILFRKTLNIENADEYCINNAQLIKDVFTKSLRHTMTVKMIAELINENICSLETILQNLQKDNLDFGENKFEHNEKNEFTTILGHLKTLFECTGMSKEEKDILRQMTLIANDGILETDFLNALGKKDAGLIVRLSSLGYIIRELDSFSFKLSMHHLIRESVAAQTRPNNENCNEILSYIYSYCHADSATLYSDLSLKKNMASHALDILRKYGSSYDTRLSEELVKTLTLLGQTNDVYTEIAEVEKDGVFSPELCYKKAVLDYSKFADGKKKLFEAMERCAERGYYDWATMIGRELISVSSIKEFKNSALSKKVYTYAMKADMPVCATIFNTIGRGNKKDNHQSIYKKDKVLGYFADFFDISCKILNSSHYSESELSQVGIQMLDDVINEEEFGVLNDFKMMVMNFKFNGYARRLLNFFVDGYDKKSKYEDIMKYLLASVLYSKDYRMLKWREIVRKKCGRDSKKAEMFEECSKGFTVDILSNFMKIVMNELPTLGNYYLSKKLLLSIYWKITELVDSYEKNELRRNFIEEQKQSVRKKLSNNEFNAETVSELQILIELLMEDGDFAVAEQYANNLSDICMRCLGYKNDVVVDSCLYLYNIGVAKMGSRVFGSNPVIGKAMPLLKERLDYYEQLYGKDSQQIASYYIDYAYKLLRTDVESAGKYAKKAWEIFERSDITEVVSEAQTYCAVMKYVDKDATLEFARKVIEKLKISKVKSRKMNGNICWFLEYIAYNTCDQDEKIRCFIYSVKINKNLNRNRALIKYYRELAIIYGVGKGDFKTALVYIDRAYSLDCKYMYKEYPYFADILFRQGKYDFTNSAEFDKLLKKHYKKNKEIKRLYPNYAIFRENVLDRYKQKKNENEYDKEYYWLKFIKISAVVKKIIDKLEKYANDDMFFRMKIEQIIIDLFVKYVGY